MLQLRPNCELCEKYLPPNSSEAMICSYECTFCTECVSNELQNVCPNCGGGFEKRPVRPREELIKNPASKTRVAKDIDTNSFNMLLNKYLGTAPEDR